MMTLGGYTLLAEMIIVTWTVLCTSVKGHKVRACAGYKAHLNCSSGLHVDVISADGGFGPSGTPCTSKASCNASYVQGALTEVNGSLDGLFKSICGSKRACDVFINSSWQAPTSDCNNQTYNATYVDVEYSCTSVIKTTATPSLTTTSTPETKTITRTKVVTELQEDKTTSVNTTVRTAVKNATFVMSVTISTAQVTYVTDSEETNLNTGTAWWWYIAGGGAGLGLIVLIIIIVVLVRRKRSRQDDKIEYGQNTSTEDANRQSNDVIPYATTMTASVSDNIPDILYEDIYYGDNDDARSSKIHCYATTSNKFNDVHSPDDVSTSNNVTADVPVYASVNKDKKTEHVSFDTVLVDNENYIAS